MRNSGIRFIHWLHLIVLSTYLVGIVLSTTGYADNVINDDLIVQGKACVGGTDCADGEDFTDTDLKIKFNDTPTLQFEQTASGGFPAQVWDVSGNEISFVIADHTADLIPFTIETNAPENSFYLAASGRVGLGTATPQGDLHIFGTAGSDVFNGIGPDPGTGPALNFGYAGSSFGEGAGFFNVRPDGSATGINPALYFATVNAVRVVITNIGRVGIGTTSPTQQLDVSGNIRASGSFIAGGTTLNVPDYVFEPDYQLMPLPELAAFVEEKKHLPDIPSAREIKEQGVNVSELQMQLLKKVEELTLYTIEQDNKFSTLQQQNHALRAENVQLQERLSAIEALLKDLVHR